jgi:hypothetical protein
LAEPVLHSHDDFKLEADKKKKKNREAETHQQKQAVPGQEILNCK